MASRKLRIGLIVTAVVALGIQLVPVERTNPPETAPLQAPPDVMRVLDRSCADCHSNRTVWPWYSHVAPVSWLVASDVAEAREHVNLSTWGALDPKRQDHHREEMWEEVEDGEMPLWTYRLMHPAARLSDADRAVLRRWAGEAEGDRDRD